MKLPGLLAVVATLSACGGGDAEVSGPSTVHAEIDGDYAGGFEQVFVDCAQGGLPELAICEFGFDERTEDGVFLWLTFSIDWRSVPAGTLLIQGSDFDIESFVFASGDDYAGAMELGGTLTVEVDATAHASGA